MPSGLPPVANSPVWSATPGLTVQKATVGVVVPPVPAGLRLQNVLPPHHHMHTPIPPQAVIKSGILAPGDPVHETLWMLNHREFPLHSVSLSEGGKGTLGWWWLWRGWGYWMKFKCQEKIGKE